MRYAVHVDAEGEAFYRGGREQELEGVIAKHRRSLYEPGRRARHVAEDQGATGAGARRRRLPAGRGHATELGAVLVGVRTRTASSGTPAASAAGSTPSTRRELRERLETHDPAERRRSIRRRIARATCARHAGSSRRSSSGPSSRTGRATTWSARRPSRASNARRTRDRSSASAPVRPTKRRQTRNARSTDAENGEADADLEVVDRTRRRRSEAAEPHDEEATRSAGDTAPRHRAGRRRRRCRSRGPDSPAAEAAPRPAEADRVDPPRRRPARSSPAVGRTTLAPPGRR